MREDEFNQVKVTNEGSNFRHEYTNAQKTEYSFQSENSYQSVSDEKREKASNEDHEVKQERNESRSSNSSKEKENEQIKEEMMNGSESSSSSSSSSSLSSSSGSASSSSSAASASSSASAVSSAVATAASVLTVATVATAAGFEVIRNKATCTFQELNIFTDRVEYALVIQNNDSDADAFNITVSSDSYSESNKLTGGKNTGEFIGLESGQSYRILVQEEGDNGETLYDKEFTTVDEKKEEPPVYSSEVTAFELFDDINYQNYEFRMRITYTDEANIFSDFELYMQDLDDADAGERVFSLEKTTDMQYVSLLVDNEIVINPDHRLKYEFSYFDSSKNERIVYQTNTNFRFQPPAYSSEVTAFRLFNDINYQNYEFRMRITYTDDANIFSDFELYMQDLDDADAGERVFSLEKTTNMQYVSLLVDNEIVINPDHRLKYEFSYFDSSKNERVVYTTNTNFHFQETNAYIGKFSINSKAAISDSVFTVNTSIDNDGALSDFELYMEDLTIKQAKEETPEEFQFDYQHTFSFDISNGTQQVKFLDEEAGYEFRPEDTFKYELSYRRHGVKVVHESNESFTFDNTAFNDFFIQPTLTSDYVMTYNLDYNGEPSQIDSLTLAFYDTNGNVVSGLEAISLNIGESGADLTYGFTYFSEAAKEALLSQTLVPHLYGGIAYKDESYDRIDRDFKPVTFVQQGIRCVISNNNYEISENNIVKLMVKGDDPESLYDNGLNIVFSNIENADMTFGLSLTSADLNEYKEYDLTNCGYSISDLVNNTFAVSVTCDGQTLYESSAQIPFSYAGEIEPTIEDFISEDNFMVDGDNYFYGNLFNIHDPFGKLTTLKLNFKDITTDSDFYEQEFSFALDITEDRQEFDLNGIVVDNFNIFDYLENDQFELTVVDVELATTLVAREMKFDYKPDYEDSLSITMDSECYITNTSFNATLNMSNDGGTYDNANPVIVLMREDGKKSFRIPTSLEDWDGNNRKLSISDSASMSDLVDQNYAIYVVDANDSDNVLWTRPDPITFYQGQSTDFLNGFTNQEFLVSEYDSSQVMNISLDMRNNSTPPTYDELYVKFTPVNGTAGSPFTVNVVATSDAQQVNLDDVYQSIQFGIEYNWVIGGFVYNGEDYDSVDSIATSSEPIVFTDNSSSGSDVTGTFNDFITTWQINESHIMEFLLDYTEEGEYFNNFRLDLYPQDGSGNHFEIEIPEKTSVQVDMYDNVPETYTDLYGNVPFIVKVTADTPEETKKVLKTFTDVNFTDESKQHAEPTFDSFSSDFVINSNNLITVNLIYDDQYGDYQSFIMNIKDLNTNGETLNKNITIENPVVGDNTVDLSSLSDDEINNILLNEDYTFIISMKAVTSAGEEDVGTPIQNQTFTRSN